MSTVNLALSDTDHAALRRIIQRYLDEEAVYTRDGMDIRVRRNEWPDSPAARSLKRRLLHLDSQ